MNFSFVLLIGAGGFMGTITRFLVVHLIDARFSPTFPWGTLIVNISGCFLIGLIYGLNVREEMLTKNWRLFLTTGFCGGYTTFSAFALENFVLIQQRSISPALLYIVISVIGGILATLIGALLGKAIHQ